MAAILILFLLPAPQRGGFPLKYKAEENAMSAGYTQSRFGAIDRDLSMLSQRYSEAWSNMRNSTHPGIPSEWIKRKLTDLGLETDLSTFETKVKGYNKFLQVSPAVHSPSPHCLHHFISTNKGRRFTLCFAKSVPWNKCSWYCPVTPWTWFRSNSIARALPCRVGS